MAYPRLATVSSLAVLAYNPHNTMANYFFTGGDGIKRGPYNEQQLQELITRGLIGANTPLETDTGHTGLTGQIPGLNFNNAVPPSFTRPAQTAPKMSNRVHSHESELSERNLSLLDFGFRDIRLSQSVRSACQYIYTGYIVLGIISGIFGAIAAGNTGDFEGFMIFVLVFIFTFPYSVFLVRTVCEWQIVLMDYINQRSHRE